MPKKKKKRISTNLMHGIEGVWRTSEVADAPTLSSSLLHPYVLSLPLPIFLSSLSFTFFTSPWMPKASFSSRKPTPFFPYCMYHFPALSSPFSRFALLLFLYVNTFCFTFSNELCFSYRHICYVVVRSLDNCVLLWLLGRKS